MEGLHNDDATVLSILENDMFLVALAAKKQN
jgi:hypothetical protein